MPRRQIRTAFPSQSARAAARRNSRPTKVWNGGATLEDAGKYITKLPKAEHEAAEWQAAMEDLILVATVGGPPEIAC
jgi:hypothetical protein